MIAECDFRNVARRVEQGVRDRYLIEVMTVEDLNENWVRLGLVDQHSTLELFVNWDCSVHVESQGRIFREDESLDASLEDGRVSEILAMIAEFAQTGSIAARNPTRARRPLSGWHPWHEREEEP